MEELTPKRQILIGEDGPSSGGSLYSLIVNRFPDTDVLAFSDGYALARKLRQDLDSVCAVVLDRGISGISSEHILRGYSGRGPRFVVCAENLEARRVKEAGAFEYVQKPVIISRLVGAVQRAIDAPRDLIA